MVALLHGIPGSGAIWQAVARHGRLAVYDGARHFLPGERPKQLASDLRQLIQDSAP